MKKVFIALLLVLGTVALCAQDSGNWYFSILPGYQFSSGNSRSGFVGSLDSGYYFSDTVGIHFDYTYNQGKFEERVYLYVPPYYVGDYDFKYSSSFNMIEVGPEFGGKVGDNGKIYGQINLGHTFGGGTVSAYGYDLGNIRSNKFTYGAAFGYRHFLNDRVGLNAQLTYHHVNGWSGSNFWDGRFGVTFKF